MRSRFNEQLARLNKELITMGARCENAIALSVKALLTGDMTLAKEVKSIETDIDESERAIESICMKLLLHQQPVARDLRQISAALKMITDMERIGDHGGYRRDRPAGKYTGRRGYGVCWRYGPGDHQDGHRQRRRLCEL